MAPIKKVDLHSLTVYLPVTSFIAEVSWMNINLICPFYN